VERTEAAREMTSIMTICRILRDLQLISRRDTSLALQMHLSATGCGARPTNFTLESLEELDESVQTQYYRPPESSHAGAKGGCEIDHLIAVYPS
jgi:hypothetical protein